MIRAFWNCYQGDTGSVIGQGYIGCVLRNGPVIWPGGNDTTQRAIAAINAATTVSTFSNDLDVPFVPTPFDVVMAMLSVAMLKPDDHVWDLGCGDARMVIAAAMKYGVRGVGVELDPERAAQARKEVEWAGVGDAVRIIEADVLTVDFSTATVVMLFLLTSTNLQLRPKLLAMPPGTRIISHRFAMGNWTPEAAWTLGNAPIYRWIVPEHGPELLRQLDGQLDEE